MGGGEEVGRGGRVRGREMLNVPLPSKSWFHFGRFTLDKKKGGMHIGGGRREKGYKKKRKIGVQSVECRE